MHQLLVGPQFLRLVTFHDGGGVIALAIISHAER
ncbi:MAG: hypothetical protein JWQ04_2362 [Pedosphaera sp.]|nr:hypothetical protein [Pedosphaera sp.]